MIKKKTLINILIPTSIALVGMTIGLGYMHNSVRNQYISYGKAPVSSSTPDLIQAYFAAAVNGSKLLYLASYSHTSALIEALNISKKSSETMYRYFSKTGFLLIDDKYGNPKFNKNNLFDLNVSQPIWSTNVASAQFRSDLGSFITGIAAGEFLNENKEYFLSDNGGNQKLRWATYGGGLNPSVISFMGGFEKGAQWFNENIVKKNNDYVPLEHVVINKDDFNANFSGSFAPGGATSLIDNFLERKIDLILPVAGPQIIDIVKAIKEKQLKTVIIGVDSPVEANTSVNSPLIGLGDNQIGNNQIIQFSTVKNINVISNKITQLIDNPLLKDTDPITYSNIGGIGYNSLGDVTNGGVGVSKAGQNYFVTAIKKYADMNNLDLDLSVPENSYNNAIKLLSSTPEFKKLDDRDQKFYLRPDWDYAEIPNESSYMLPIYETNENIDKWYSYYFKDNSDLIQLKTENLSRISDWINKNQQTIDFRKNMSIDQLENKLNKDNYDKNHSLIKIIYESPTSILFDKSFLESCYNGLLSYWKTKGVKLPPPPNGEIIS